MRTEDHFLLAAELTRTYDIGWLNRRMFLLGNIEPDYNRLSYLGHHVTYFSLGHSFKARKRRYRRFFRHMKHLHKHSPLWWFEAGRTFHYMTDSFTRPHNPEFGYRSPEHIAYEHDLKKIFFYRLKHRKKLWTTPVITGNPFEWIYARHEEYLSRTKGIEDDAYYICTTIPAVWNWLTAHLDRQNAGLLD